MMRPALKTITAALIVLLSIPSLSFHESGSGEFPEPTRAPVIHSPISINGNAQLASTASSEGWPGTGSEGDPILIRNFKIMAGQSYAIDIRNTDLYLEISGCNLSSSSVAGLHLFNVENCAARDNLMVMNSGDGILIENSRGIDVNNNTMDMEDIFNMNYNGIRLIGSTGCDIAFNIIHLSVSDAINIDSGSAGNHIRNNSLEENRNNGIYVGSGPNHISGNRIYANKNGVKLDSSDNIAEENRLIKNIYGVLMHSGARNTVKDNYIIRNSIGIQFFRSDDNLITDNLFLLCAVYGIDLYQVGSSGNEIHHNEFFRNNQTGTSYDPGKIQSRDLSGGNQWYSASNEGNFWLDWTTPDSNQDGIVDTPYDIVGGSVYDLYPLSDSEYPDLSIPPKKLRADPFDDHIELSWNGINYGKGILTDHFNIYKGEREGGEFWAARTADDVPVFRDYDVLPGRSYYYYVTSVTRIAESERSNRVKSSPDTKPPAVQFDHPKDNDFINESTVYVQWTGKDNIEVERYELWMDGEGPVTILDSDFFIYYNLSEGSHRANITAFDHAEHKDEDIVTFTVDLTPPALFFQGEEESPLIFGTETPTVRWSAEDTLSGISGFFLDIDGEGSKWIGNINSLKMPALSQGPHDITLKVQDRAGNIFPKNITIIIDTSDPVLTLQLSLYEPYTRDRSVRINYSASDSITGIDHYEVRVDTEEWRGKGQVKYHVFDYLDQGEHFLYAKALDLAGNEDISYTVATVDWTPPELNLITPSQDGLYSKEILLRFTTWDEISGVGRQRIRLDGGDWRDLGSDESVPIGFTKDGDHTLEMEVFDRAGNLARRSVDFRFDVTKPAISTAEPRGAGIPIDTDLHLGFSEIMDKATVAISAQGITGEMKWSGNNLTLDTDVPLMYGKKYSIAVSGKDIAGNELIPFDWFFVTEDDPMEAAGRIIARVVDGSGEPIFNASYRFKTGESGKVDDEGRIDTLVKAGSNSIIITNKTFKDRTVEFSIQPGEELDLGDIKLESTLGGEEKEEKGTSYTWIIVMAIVVLLVAGVATIVAVQYRKAKAYEKMDFGDQEWTNVTDIGYPGRKAP
ncbi:MAG: NosD domain-containing protein [Thermoplasmatota archaeon]